MKDKKTLLQYLFYGSVFCCLAVFSSLWIMFLLTLPDNIATGNSSSIVESADFCDLPQNLLQINKKKNNQSSNQTFRRTRDLSCAQIKWSIPTVAIRETEKSVNTTPARYPAADPAIFVRAGPSVILLKNTIISLLKYSKNNRGIDFR